MGGAEIFAWGGMVDRAMGLSYRIGAEHFWKLGIAESYHAVVAFLRDGVNLNFHPRFFCR